MKNLTRPRPIFFAGILALVACNASASGSEQLQGFLFFGLPASLIVTALAVRWLASRTWVRVALSLPIFLLTCFCSAQIIEWSLKSRYEWWEEEIPYFRSSILNVELAPNPVDRRSRYKTGSSPDTLSVQVSLSDGFHSGDPNFVVMLICRDAWIRVGQTLHKPSGGNCGEQAAVRSGGAPASLVFDIRGGLTDRFDLHLPVSNIAGVTRSETTTYVKKVRASD